jgi:quercetin dioxygenase-like cupin family protein
MKRTRAAALALLASCQVLADPPAQVMNIMRDAELKFAPSKTTPGISQAVISGNPATPGQVYVVRNRFSPGTFSQPHFHPETRYITVIKGTWWVGPSATIRVDEAGQPKN